MSRLSVLDQLEPTLLWDGDTVVYDDTNLSDLDPTITPARGPAATLSRFRGETRVLRDPIGLNKLFWAPSEDGVDLASRPWALVEHGHRLEDIRAVPRGAVVVPVERNDGANDMFVPSSPQPTRLPPSEIPSIAADIADSVERYLAAIAERYPTADVYVCLSGGLDSSGIAAAAREHWPNLIAVSFDLDDGGRSSDDRRIAKQLSAEWGMPLLEATASPAALLDHLDTVLREGIDWRDFNVHAALVNAALAETIATNRTDSRPCLVLTGDLANELLVDYEAEQYRGETYYALPRLRPGSLQKALLAGLESVHREIGVFGAWDLTVVQPYSVAVDQFLSLPEDFLSDSTAKRQLNREMYGSRLPTYIYDRKKVRAQVGSERTGRGVLATCVDAGIDQAYLTKRFAGLHRTSPAALSHFIRGGRYRSGRPTLEDPCT